jgi:molybdopterin-binding protein
VKLAATAIWVWAASAEEARKAPSAATSAVSLKLDLLAFSNRAKAALLAGLHESKRRREDSPAVICRDTYRAIVEPAKRKVTERMKISARNKLHGTILDVTKGATTAHVRIDVGGGAVVTASITNEAVDELKLAKGQKAYAVIKATDVMVGLD